MMEHPLAFPTVKVCSCYITDQRTFHVDLSNDTDRGRPLLFTNCSRSWFRDSTRFFGQALRAQLQARTPGTVP